MNTRIIVKLDVKPPNVVKPVYFEGLRIIGKPDELAKKYYLQGADEIFYIDIVSSLYQREILYEYIQDTANELFVPFAVGGGVKNINDFSKLFHLGADKVVINTYALQQDPEIINKAAEIFGKQAVLVNIEAKKRGDNWECYSDCGRIQSGTDVFEWIKEVEQRGAGEILFQSVDNDGAQRGFDTDLAKKIVSLVNIPVVIASGAGSLEDIKEVINKANPSGVAISSLLHYDKFTVSDIKDYLRKYKIAVSR